MADHWDRQYPAVKRIKEAYELIGKCLDELDWSMWDRCDCGCLRNAHVRNGPCWCGDCEGFTDAFDYPDNNPWRRAA